MPYLIKILFVINRTCNTLSFFLYPAHYIYPELWLAELEYVH